MRAKKHIYLDKEALRELQKNHGVQGMGYYFDLSPSSTHLKVSPLMLFTLIDFFADKEYENFTDVQSTIWKGLCREVNSDHTSVKLAEFNDNHANSAHYKIFSAALRSVYSTSSTTFSLYIPGQPDQLGRTTINNTAGYRDHPIFSDLFLAWILIGDDDEKKREFTVRYFKKIKELASSNKEAMQELKEYGSNPYETPMGHLGQSYRYISQESDSIESPSRDMRKLLGGKRKEKTTETVSCTYRSTHEVDKITYKDFGNKICPYTPVELVNVFQEHITKAILHDRNKASDKQRRFDGNKAYLVGLSVAQMIGCLTCDRLRGAAWKSTGIRLAYNGISAASSYYISIHEDMKAVDTKSNAYLMAFLTLLSYSSASDQYKYIHNFDSKPAIAINSLLLAANLYVTYTQSKAVYDDYVGRS